MKRAARRTIFVLLLVLAAPAGAQLTAARTLHGLNEITLVVANLHPDAERRGLSKATLQARIAARLRQAGLRVAPPVTPQAAPARPVLYLQVNIVPLESFPVYVTTVELQLHQHSCLARNLIICEPVITWEDTRTVRTVGVSNLTNVEQEVYALVDHFTAAYLTENSQR